MCQVTPRSRLVLSSDLRAPQLARRFLRDAVCPYHHGDVLDAAVLLVSELVSNAVLHGSPPVTLVVDCDSTGGLVVRVTDGSDRLPVERSSGPMEPGGRGIGLFDVLSDDWGVDTGVGEEGAEGTARGKTVWFRLRVPAA